MPDLSICTEVDGTTTVLRLKGWAGLDSQAQLELAVTRLSAVKHSLLLLDLTELTGLCSLAVGQLIALHRAVRHRGGEIRIGGASDDVRTMLVRCRLDALMPIFPSMNEAAAAH